MLRRPDRRATADLLPLAYDELLVVVTARVAEAAPGHPIDGTALVHEAYLRLEVGAGLAPRVPGKGNSESAGHFFPGGGIEGRSHSRRCPMSSAEHANPSVSNVDPNLTTGVGPDAAAVGVPASVTGRYRLGDEIDRGGMGIIYRATDTVLGREVAVKVLHEEFTPNSGAAFRFAGEARITGQLQHPSIPPVHDLGALPDGRPFLAMKLIKGRTLAELLKAGPDPSAERGRFVAVFEQICQALA